MSTDLASAAPDIAVIIPCHDEEAAIADVVRDMRAALPEATVYVYENNCTDRTAEVARAAGAVVRSEPAKGKGNVVRRAFADITADVYVIIDGDGTYDAAAAPALVERLVAENLDHVVGVRRALPDALSAFRPRHEWGNRLLNRIVCGIFGDSHADMLSGYRVFSRRFVKSFPAVSREFEIETELTIHSLALRIPTATVETDFCDRAAGSESKLRTYRDGLHILRMIVRLARHERPLAFFGTLALLGGLIGLGLFSPVAVEYLLTGQVPRLPSLLVASVLGLGSLLMLLVGAVLDGTRQSRHENSRLSYLRYATVQDDVRSHLRSMVRVLSEGQQQVVAREIPRVPQPLAEPAVA